MSRLKRLIDELKRRRVFRVAIVYAVVAFVIWQAAEIAVPGLNLPGWVLTLVILLTVLGFPIALVLAWALELTPEGIRVTPPAEQGEATAGDEELTGAPAAEPDKPVLARQPGDDGPSVVVLPFANLSGDPENEYFSDGVTEDIMARLAGIRGLRVISRTTAMRYKGSDLSLPQIAEELSVGAVVEGTVRRSGDRVRVTAQLIAAERDEHLWAETYDRVLEDVFAIQSEVATHIAAALNASLSPRERESLRESPTDDLEAYNLLLLGRYHYARGEFWRSVEYYQRAIELDPEFVQAYAELAEAWHYQGAGYWDLRPKDAYPQVKRAACRALELDPLHADALAIHGLNEFWHNLDWETGEEELRRAIELSPKSIVPRLYYALLRMCGGRFAEAEAEIAHFLELDPGNLVMISNAAVISYIAGDHERSVRRFERLAELNPAWPWWAMVGLPFVKMGRLSEAVSAFQEGVRLSQRANMQLQLLAYGYAAAGDEQSSRSILEELEIREREGWVWPLGFAYAYAHLGERERALARLQQAFEERAGLPFLRDPAFDILLDDERYRRILKESGQDYGL